MKWLWAVLLIPVVALATGRDTQGNYSLYTPGNPVVSGTTISSTWANNTLGDIKSEITNSLDRSGRGGMWAPLRVTNENKDHPSYSWTAETNSGWYRAGTNDFRFSVAGTDRLQISSAGISVPGVSTAGPVYVNGSGTLTTTQPTVVWFQVGSTSIYYAKVNGIVFLRGSATMTNTVSLGTLAAGYRPGQTGYYQMLPTGTAESLAIGTNGALVPSISGGPGLRTVDGISFPAEQ